MRTKMLWDSDSVITLLVSCLSVLQYHLVSKPHRKGGINTGEKATAQPLSLFSKVFELLCSISQDWNWIENSSDSWTSNNVDARFSWLMTLHQVLNKNHKSWTTHYNLHTIGKAVKHWTNIAHSETLINLDFGSNSFEIENSSDSWTSNNVDARFLWLMTLHQVLNKNHNSWTTRYNLYTIGKAFKHWTNTAHSETLFIHVFRFKLWFSRPKV